MIVFHPNINENDWFIVICLLLAYALVFRLPRLFPKSISALVMFFSLSLAKGADNTLGVKPLDLYDTNEIPKFDVIDLFTWAIYPAAGYLFIYLYHRLGVRGAYISIFIIICSLLSTWFEYICVQFKVFHYKEWTLTYSFITYLLVQQLTILLFEFLKYKYREAKGHVLSKKVIRKS
jgi:hypothetical protein